MIATAAIIGCAGYTGQETLEEIVTKLAAQYRVSPEELRPDVIEYLNRLRSRNLLEISSEKL